MSMTPDNWTNEQNTLFARVYRHMEANQLVFTHPKAARVTNEHWQTTCWNAAYFAAACVEDEDAWIHVNEEGDVLGAEVHLGAMS